MISFPAPAFRPRCRSRANILVGGSGKVQPIGRPDSDEKPRKGWSKWMQEQPVSFLVLLPVPAPAWGGQKNSRGSGRKALTSLWAIVRETGVFVSFGPVHSFFHLACIRVLRTYPYFFTLFLVFLAPSTPTPTFADTVALAHPGLHRDVEPPPSSRPGRGHGHGPGHGRRGVSLNARARASHTHGDHQTGGAETAKPASTLMHPMQDSQDPLRSQRAMRELYEVKDRQLHL